MTAIPLPTAETPLLSHSSSLEPKSLLGYNANTHGNNNIVSSTINDHELHFYNPAAILDVSREVAFAYLILLTGGAVEYVAPAALVKGGIDLETSSSSSPTAQQQPQAVDNAKSHPPDDSKTVGEDDRSKKTTTNVNDGSASLAYAAIVDGNVLHACFGLKSTPNGRISNNSVIPKNGGGGGDGTTPPPPAQRSSYFSLFCCFPLGGGASSPTLDALHLLLSNLSSNRTKMQHLVEILREVREMQLESSSLGGVGGSAASTGGGALYNNISNSTAKSPLHLQVIHAYIHCFTHIVRYHDAKDTILRCDTACSPNGCGGGKKTKKKSKSNMTCYELIKKMNILSRKTKNSDPRLEQLRIDTLHEIEKGFHGLKEDIWESLERMATETSFTGCASLEESTSGGSSISKANRSVNQLP